MVKGTKIRWDLAFGGESKPSEDWRRKAEMFAPKLQTDDRWVGKILARLQGWLLSQIRKARRMDKESCSIMAAFRLTKILLLTAVIG
jgi:hypothetical protein